MNKITLPLTIIALVVSIASFIIIFSSQNAVYVDVNKIIDGYKRTKDVRVEFEVKAKTLNSNVDSLMVDWQNELKAYEKERISLTNKELKLKQELLSNRQQQINNYQQAIQKQIQEEDQKATQTVINDINDFVKEFGETHKYKIIFGASGGGNIMYAKEQTDLTDEILKGLNEAYLKN